MAEPPFWSGLAATAAPPGSEETLEADEGTAPRGAWERANRLAQDLGFWGVGDWTGAEEVAASGSMLVESACAASSAWETEASFA
jgi:hypothetical protein